MPDNGYATEQRAKLDAKITELRAEGWDVVARRERDLALSQRDDARDEVAELQDRIADTNAQFNAAYTLQEHWRERAELAEKLNRQWLDEKRTNAR